ncbi:MAG: DUF4411 family protein [Chloroflexi bacterium]|nr:DUF4411 family protein [Chloroflexota bacterium]
MPDWFDTDSFVTPCRGPYRFATSPNFWAFLAQKAKDGVIASPEMVLNELLQGEDQLKVWARQQTELFRPARADVQAMAAQIITGVIDSGIYAPQHVAVFVGGADPWVIAHAKVFGGRIVTFERMDPPNSHRPKIPNVAASFGVRCIELWDLLPELGWTS